MLHDFGGVDGFFGNPEWVNTPVIEARANIPNLVGIGMTPEGMGERSFIRFLCFHCRDFWRLSFVSQRRIGLD